MDDRQTMRASDHDRQQVVDLLCGALEDGRLRMDEYVDRMGRAYQAVTYGDLVPLHADLPAAGHMAPATTAQAAAAQAATALKSCPATAFARLPAVLRVLWAVWFSAVSVNVVVWALVSVTTGQLIYPWPLWVAGPYGAALFAMSAAATVSRRSREQLITAGRP
jgi:Domain of unknown function (DUF1707)